MDFFFSRMGSFCLSLLKRVACVTDVQLHYQLRCKIFIRTYTRICVGYASCNYKPACIFRSTYGFYPLTMAITK